MKWYVDFCEWGGDGERNYKGEELTKTLVKELERLDDQVHEMRERGEVMGYFKFFFKSESRELRIDIGDGEERNWEKFEFLRSQL